MKKIFYALLILTLSLVGCGKKESKEVVKNLKSVTLGAVEVRTISDKYEVDSSALSKNKINHIIETTGTVEKINFLNGESVKKNQVVLSLSDSKASGDYRSAKSSLDAAKTNLDVRRLNFNKFQSLFDKQLISETEYLDQKTRFSDAEAQYLTRKAALEEIENNFKELNRVANISGTIANITVKEGMEVRRGDNLFTVIDDSQMEFLVDVPGNVLSKIQIGSLANVNVTDIVEEVFSGKIVEINPIATPDTKKYKVKVTVENSDRKIKEGMYAKLSVPTGERVVKLVPQKALFVKSLQGYVYIVENGKAKRVEVTTGNMVGDFIEISSDSLKDGDKIIVEGLSNLNDGEEVEVK